MCSRGVGVNETGEHNLDEERENKEVPPYLAVAGNQGVEGEVDLGFGEQLYARRSVGNSM